MKSPDVLCVGASSWDQTFELDHHPAPDEKTTALSLTAGGGGPAATAAVAAAKTGLSAAFCGYIGNDYYGQCQMKELQNAEVDTSLVVRGNTPTPLSTIWVKPNGERALVNYRPPRNILPADSIDFSGIRPKVILFDGHEPAISRRLCDYAREKGIPTILDGGSVHDGTRQLIAEVDYLICSQKFAAQFTGETNPEAALRKLSRINAKTVITLGAAGLIWNIEDKNGSLPAFPVHSKDTTGAGDVFHGVFAACIATGKDWNKALKYAAAAAALSCTGIGARSAIPTMREIESFLENQAPHSG